MIALLLTYSCKNCLELTDGYQLDIETAKLVSTVAAHFEECASADTNWLSWGTHLLPNLKHKMTRYQEAVAREVAAAAERELIKYER